MRGRVTGDWRQAAEHLEGVLSDFERVYGDNNVHTVTTRNELALAFHYAGDIDRSIILYEQAYHAFQTLPVPEYPVLLNACMNLADAYRAKGNMTRAAELYEEAFSRYKRVLGPDYADTIGAAVGAAESHRSYGNRARALEIYREILATALASLGENHQSTQGIRREIADLTGSPG